MSRLPALPRRRMAPSCLLFLRLAALAALAAWVPSPAWALTLAVSYFDNRSGQEQWQPLSKGLADMLITDLAETEGVTVVERDRLQAVLAEINLGKSKFIDPATAQRLGKGLGATHIMTGAYQFSGAKVRIDARAIDVATGAVTVTAENTGPSDDIFAVEAKLAEKLRGGLALKKKDGATKQVKVSAEDVRTYGMGLDAMDEGRMDESRKILGALAMQRPDFAQVQRGLDQLSRRIKQLLEQSKYAPEKIVALATDVEAGKTEACSQLMTELTSLQGAASRAAVKILSPDGTDKAEIGRTLASFYAVTLLLLDKPKLSQPICPGNQAPAATAVALFLFTLHMAANQVMDCHPVHVAMNPSPQARQQACERVLKRVPDLSDAQGKLLVAAADYPALMVQLGQVMLERFPSSVWMQSLLPIMQTYVEHLKVASLTGKDREAALSRGMVDKARASFSQQTAYADMYLAIIMVPQTPALVESLAGSTARLTLSLSDGDIALGIGKIELSTDAGKTWPHVWPLKDDPPGHAARHLKLDVNPGGKLLVGDVSRRKGSDGPPEIDVAATRWNREAVWLGKPWSPADLNNVVMRLVARDGTELGRCPVAFDAETSERANKAWLYAKAMCKAP